MTETTTGATYTKTATSIGTGTFSFDEITYDKPGTYTYTVKETSTAPNGWTLDTKEYQITVVVTDNGQGQLVAAITKDGTAVSGNTVSGLDFTNSYNADSVTVHFNGTKTESKGVYSGEALTWTFTMTETTEGAEYSDTATRSGAGNFRFDDIEYTEPG